MSRCKWAVPHVSADVLWTEGERDGFMEILKLENVSSGETHVRWAQFLAQRWSGIRSQYKFVNGGMPFCEHGGLIDFIEVEFIPRIHQPALICNRCSGVPREIMPSANAPSEERK